MSNYARITGITVEAYDTKTIEFQWDEKARPGQFAMAWVPGMEEIPMSLSKIGRIKSITVKNIGESTNRLHQLTIGDTLRLRGPYGSGYDLKKGVKYLVVGGGIGVASVLPVIKETGADTIIGARTDKDIILYDQAHRYASDIWISTDDGSRGFHGNAVELMREKCDENRYDCVIACGPEAMLYHLYKACEDLGLDCQMSLERHMKCGAGLCGCCMIDDQRVCKDGPVFNKEQLSGMTEFGVSKRDTCGRLVKFG
ncbi:MAG: dihydroorotate dehydrogenase electron transfer subunit [Euryarchaeota archaeon]|nr:dihydroorotate dehydrogenase electron transfer subunit [Euryarchaeota archaeon]